MSEVQFYTGLNFANIENVILICIRRQKNGLNGISLCCAATDDHAKEKSLSYRFICARTVARVVSTHFLFLRREAAPKKVFYFTLMCCRVFACKKYVNILVTELTIIIFLRDFIT
jgi:hypothetical protein